MVMEVLVFNNYTHLAMTEYLAQSVNAFNEASQGVIKLIVNPTKGNFDISSSFAAINGIVRRRNPFGTGSIEQKNLKQIQNAGVKVPAGTPTLNWTKQEYTWTQQNPELAADTIGKQLSKGVLGDMLNTALLGGVAAFKNQPEALYTGSPDIAGLVNTAANFGDRSSAIKAWVMHSGFANQLINYALQNSYRLFTIESVNILKDPFGRTFIITDSPSLLEMQQKAASQYFALGLVEDGITVSKNDDFNSEIVVVNGGENIVYSYQAEWTYNLAIKGYAWDTDNGGKAPNNTALGTGINWLKVASSIKDTAGVVLQSAPAYA